MQKKSNYENDLKSEAIVGEFLDNSFYKLKVIQDFERINGNDSLQYKGIDVSFSVDGTDLKNISVDEKAQIAYINEPTDTFIMELSSIIEGRESIGWFINKEKLTDYYFLIWISSAKSKKLIEWTDISNLDFCLVSRNRIKAYLENEGLKYDELYEIAKSIRSGDKNKRLEEHDKYNWNHKFHMNTTLAERSINIVIRKSIYLREAEFYGDIDFDREKLIFKISINGNKINKEGIISEDIFAQNCCPKCKRPLVQKDGRYGKFIGCKGFPDCKYTRNI